MLCLCGNRVFLNVRCAFWTSLNKGIQNHCEIVHAKMNTKCAEFNTLSRSGPVRNSSYLSKKTNPYWMGLSFFFFLFFFFFRTYIFSVYMKCVFFETRLRARKQNETQAQNTNQPKFMSRWPHLLFWLWNQNSGGKIPNISGTICNWWFFRNDKAIREGVVKARKHEQPTCMCMLRVMGQQKYAWIEQGIRNVNGVSCFAFASLVHVYA